MSSINVKTGQIGIGKDVDVLEALGIGSCVVVCLYDRSKKIGGLAHIMLPDKRKHSEKDLQNNKKAESAPAEFVEKGIDVLLDEMIKLGAHKNAISAKIAGGSEMFKGIRTSGLSLGLKNIGAVRQKLASVGIPVSSEDVGGTVGRSIKFFVENGDIEIRKRM